MKIHDLPWNRLTKHLCVLVMLLVVAVSYFWVRESLMLLVLMMIPLVHRIERDYRSLRKKCPHCRREKCKEEFDNTLCIDCVKDIAAEAKLKADLTRPVRSALLPSPPATEKMPPKPPMPSVRPTEVLVPRSHR